MKNINHTINGFKLILNEQKYAKQRQNNELNADSGETGSPAEDEANAEAGVLLRNFGEKYPMIFEGKINELEVNNPNDLIIGKKYDVESDVTIGKTYLGATYTGKNEDWAGFTTFDGKYSIYIPWDKRLKLTKLSSHTINELEVSKPIRTWDFNWDAKPIPNFNPAKIRVGDIIKRPSGEYKVVEIWRDTKVISMNETTYGFNIGCTYDELIRLNDNGNAPGKQPLPLDELEVNNPAPTKKQLEDQLITLLKQNIGNYTNDIWGYILNDPEFIDRTRDSLLDTIPSQVHDDPVVGGQTFGEEVALVALKLYKLQHPKINELEVTNPIIQFPIRVLNWEEYEVLAPKLEKLGYKWENGELPTKWKVKSWNYPITLMNNGKIIYYIGQFRESLDELEVNNPAPTKEEVIKLAISLNTGFRFYSYSQIFISLGFDVISDTISTFIERLPQSKVNKLYQMLKQWESQTDDNIEESQLFTKEWWKESLELDELEVSNPIKPFKMIWDEEEELKKLYYKNKLLVKYGMIYSYKDNRPDYTKINFLEDNIEDIDLFNSIPSHLIDERDNDWKVIGILLKYIDISPKALSMINELEVNKPPLKLIKGKYYRVFDIHGNRNGWQVTYDHEEHENNDIFYVFKTRDSLFAVSKEEIDSGDVRIEPYKLQETVVATSDATRNSQYADIKSAVEKTLKGFKMQSTTRGFKNSYVNSNGKATPLLATQMNKFLHNKLNIKSIKFIHDKTYNTIMIVKNTINELEINKPNKSKEDILKIHHELVENGLYGEAWKIIDNYVHDHGLGVSLTWGLPKLSQLQLNSLYKELEQLKNNGINELEVNNPTDFIIGKLYGIKEYGENDEYNEIEKNYKYIGKSQVNDHRTKTLHPEIKFWYVFKHIYGTVRKIPNNQKWRII